MQMFSGQCLTMSHVTHVRHGWGLGDLALVIIAVCLSMWKEGMLALNVRSQGCGLCHLLRTMKPDLGCWCTIRICFEQSPTAWQWWKLMLNSRALRQNTPKTQVSRYFTTGGRKSFCCGGVYLTVVDNCVCKPTKGNHMTGRGAEGSPWLFSAFSRGRMPKLHPWETVKDNGSIGILRVLLLWLFCFARLVLLSVFSGTQLTSTHLDGFLGTSLGQSLWSRRHAPCTVDPAEPLRQSLWHRSDQFREQWKEQGHQHASAILATFSQNMIKCRHRTPATEFAFSVLMPSHRVPGRKVSTVPDCFSRIRINICIIQHESPRQC